MKKLWALIFCHALLLLLGTPAAAKVAGSKATKSEFSTSHNFDGTDVNGQLQQGSLRRIVVEDDKSIEDLLGVRKKFDDRQADEKERVPSW
jgi:hypothetical protein